jgi:hypothetical protein
MAESGFDSPPRLQMITNEAQLRAYLVLKPGQNRPSACLSLNRERLSL